MSSKKQKLSGYPLPEIIRPEDTLSFCVTIPNDEAYRLAMFRQLHELGKWWNWKRDDDTQTQATESAMMWRETLTIDENCGGGFPVTPEEFYDANKRAIYDAINDVAKQIVSGRTTNISVGADGTVSDPTITEPTEDLPENNPSTPYDESAMGKSGGASGVRSGINQIWANLGAWYTASVPVANAQYRLKLIYILDDAGCDALVDAYYADRAAMAPYVASFATTLDGYLYCKGATKEIIAEWIYEVHTTNQQAQAAYIINALTDEQIAAWFNRGLDSPSTDYLAYSCVPIPDYSFTLTTYGTAFSDTHLLKKYHRYLVSVTGYFLDPDGDIQDAFWHKQVGQNEVYDPTPDLNIQISNAVKRYPTVFEVPYNSSHAYQWTIEMGPNDANPQWTINRDTGTMAAGSTSPTGGLTFTVHDLGEIVN